MKPTQEQVIAWAREAGIKSSKSNGMFYTEYWDGVCPDGFVAVMTLAYEAGRKDENEACAKVLDEMADDMVREMEPSTAITYVRSKAAEIRSRTKP